MKVPMRSVAVLACVQLAACYTYREVGRPDLRDGSTVRVFVQADEAVRQQQVIGRLTQQVEGEVVGGQPPETLGLTVVQPGGGPAARTGFNVFLSLPWTAVVRVEEKRFNTGRTLAVAGAAAVAAVAVLAINGGGTRNGDGGPPGDDARVRIPLIRLPVR